ncbi:MAG: DUF58 domain-containing protein [Gammaproteobacteria bacterium]|nr:DUF58 domain-containing protein [Gammaproteobacteria bacterium]
MQHWRNTNKIVQQTTHRVGIELTLADLFDCKKYVDALVLPKQQKVKTHLLGGFISHFKGRGMDFDEARPYQQGDDIRSIDWRVTARTGDAHTKIYREERERPVFAILDQSAPMMFGSKKQFKSVQAAKITACVMWSALADGNRFGAILFNESQHTEFKPASTRKNSLRILNNIVEHHNQRIDHIYSKDQVSTEEQNETFAKTLYRARRIIKPGSLVFVLSDFSQFDNEADDHLVRIAQHSDVNLLHVYDPLEKDLPPAGHYGITNGKQTSQLYTKDSNLRRNYVQQFNNKLTHLVDTSLRGKMRQYSISTEASLVDAFGLQSSKVS